MNLAHCNMSLHEAGHIFVAVVFGVPCSVEFGDFAVECGAASAMVWHTLGDAADDLFILCGGLAASRIFGCGEAGCLQDIADLAQITEDESIIARTVDESVLILSANLPIVLKLAFVLAKQGALSETETVEIISGKIEVTPSQEFLDTVAQVGATEWRVKV